MRTKRIALGVELDTTYGQNVVQGILRYMRKNPGWRIAMKQARPYLPVENLDQWDGDGVIAPIYAYHAPIAASLQRRCIPTVNISSANFEPAIPAVFPDNRLAGRRVAEHFLQKGLRRFAFMGPEELPFSQHRCEGFVEAVRDAGYEPAVCLFKPRAGPTLITQMVNPLTYLNQLRSLPKPVAILAANDRMGFGILEACRKLGLSSPDEVAVVGVDNDETLCALAFRPLSSVDVAGSEIGFRAAQMLDRLLQGDTGGDQRILVPPAGIITRHSSDVLAVPDHSVAEVLRFIHNHADQFIDVSDVMQVVSMSRRSLERRFRELRGHGIYQEIQQVHLGRARKFLIDSDKTITEIARISGFQTINRFEVAFRKAEGMSASQYRAAKKSG